MENEKRIYGTVADIDGNNIRQLFDGRAKIMADVGEGIRLSY